jgi:hypothetical protein
MTPAERHTLRCAARCLNDWARSLKDGHTVKGQWPTEPDRTETGVRREVERMISLARKLTVISKG